jgi:tripartite-type tricarboxylate transporter receptor subunit TctC
VNAWRSSAWRSRSTHPTKFVAVINADIAKWAKVIKDANIKLSEQKKML